MTSYYDKSVPGSAELRTRKRAADPWIAALESIEPGAMERLARGADALGRVVVRSGFVPVLDSVFEELAPRQTVPEQVLYLHLYCASYGQQKNYCRLSRAQLCQRIGLSARRFNHALAGLVDKGHVALLQRDRRGTLYRVFLPDEIFERSPGSDVMMGRVRSAESSARLTGPVKAPRPRTKGADRLRQRPARSGSAPETSAAKATRAPARKANKGHKVIPIRGIAGAAQRQRQPLSVGAVTRHLLEKMPARVRVEQSLEALQEVTDLMVEGHDLFAIDAAVQDLPPLKGRALAIGELLRQRLSED